MGLDKYLECSGISFDQKLRKYIVVDAIDYTHVYCDMDPATVEEILYDYKVILLSENAHVLFEPASQGFSISHVLAASCWIRCKLYTTLWEYCSGLDNWQVMQQIAATIKGCSRLKRPESETLLSLIEALTSVSENGPFLMESMALLSFVVERAEFEKVTSLYRKLWSRNEWAFVGILTGLRNFNGIGYCHLPSEFEPVIYEWMSKAKGHVTIQMGIFSLFQNYSLQSEQILQILDIQRTYITDPLILCRVKGSKRFANDHNSIDSIESFFFDDLLFSIHGERLIEQIMDSLVRLEVPKFVDLIVLFIIWRKPLLKYQKRVHAITLQYLTKNSVDKQLFANIVTAINGQEEHWKESFEDFIWSLFDTNQDENSNSDLLMQVWFEGLNDAQRIKFFNELIVAFGHVKSAKIVQRLLDILSTNHTGKLLKCAPSLKATFDSIESLGLEQVSMLYRVWYRLAIFSLAEGNSSLVDELIILLKKQLGSINDKIKQFGIEGLMNFLTGVSESSHAGKGYLLADDDFATCSQMDPSLKASMSRKSLYRKQAEGLLELAIQTCKSVASFSYLTCRLESILTSMDRELLEWIGSSFSLLFQERFVKELTSLSPGSNNLQLYSIDGSEASIAIDFSNSDHSNLLYTAPIHLRMLQKMENIINHGRLDNIDALLGCPILLSEIGSGNCQTKARLITLCFFKELLNAFSNQSDKDVIGKCLRRLGHVYELEGKIEQSLEQLKSISGITIDKDGLFVVDYNYIEELDSLLKVLPESPNFTPLQDFIQKYSNLLKPVEGKTITHSTVLLKPSTLEYIRPLDETVFAFFDTPLDLDPNLEEHQGHLKFVEFFQLVKEAKKLTKQQILPLLPNLAKHAIGIQNLENISTIQRGAINMILQIIISNTDHSNWSWLQECLELYASKQCDLTRKEKLVLLEGRLKVGKLSKDAIPVELEEELFGLITSPKLLVELASVLEFYLMHSKEPFKALQRILHADVNNVKFVKYTLQTANKLISKRLFALEEYGDFMMLFEEIVNNSRKNTGLFEVILRQGRASVDAICQEILLICEKKFKTDTEIILSLLKTMQRGTRSLQIICSHVKTVGDSKLHKLVPLMKKSLEMLLYRVKEMLRANNCITAFWLGNLKHRDLEGQEVASQVQLTIKATEKENYAMCNNLSRDIIETDTETIEEEEEDEEEEEELTNEETPTFKVATLGLSTGGSDLVEKSASFINPLKERELDLRDNKIPAIENLGVTKDQYDVIDLTNNELRRLDNFPTMRRLKTLLASNNQISSLDKGMGDKLVALEMLILNNNRISLIEDLDGLANIRTLRYLSLMDNPISRIANYRTGMIAKLPWLRALDFQKVSHQERQTAMATIQANEKTAKSGKRLASDETSLTGDVETKKKKDSKSNKDIGLSVDERKRIEEAIRNATSLEEISRLEKILQTGHVPDKGTK